MILRMVGDAWKAVIFGTNQKNTTEPHQPRQPHFWSKCRQYGSHNSLPRKAAREGAGEGTSPQDLSNSRLEGKNRSSGRWCWDRYWGQEWKGCCVTWEQCKHSSGTGKGWSESASFSLDFYPWLMGSNSRVGSEACLQGVSARWRAWMFSVPFTTCLLLSRRHLLALWVGKRWEPLEMVDGLERRHPLSFVAVSAVLGRRRERQDKALQAGRKGCACVRHM